MLAIDTSFLLGSFKLIQSDKLAINKTKQKTILSSLRGKLPQLRNEIIWLTLWSFRRRQWQPTPVLLPGKSHGRKNLVGCSPWGG